MSDDTIDFPTKPTKSVPTLDYNKWVAEGYMYVINRALTVVANDPKPEAGKYCIEVGFKTDFPGVVAPDWITKDQATMKIILNNQFFDLTIGEGFFSVTLYFGGVETPLSIPFAAIVWFQDGEGFTLSFEYPIEKPANDSLPEPVNTEEKDTTADIVSLDAFRGNNNEGDS